MKGGLGGQGVCQPSSALRWQPGPGVASTECMTPVDMRNGRAAVSHGAQADPPGVLLQALALFIVLGSCLDAYFTLIHLQNGAREVNPLMNLAIEVGPRFFVAVKTFITGAGVVVLAAIGPKKIRALALGSVAVCYSALLAYHGALFSLYGAT